jgi:hypothetical protein
MSLAALVEGYVQGQELQQKKAKEVSNQESEKWERQFRLQQSQDSAKQASVRAEQEEKRIALEKLAIDQRAKKEEAQEAQKKQEELGRNTRAELAANTKKYAADLTTERGREGLVAKYIPQFMKVYPTLEEATQAARAIVNQQAQEYNAPLPDGSLVPQVSPGQFQAPQANTSGLEFHLPQAQGPNPLFQMQQANIQKALGQAQQAVSTANLRDQQAKTNEAMRQVDEAAKKATAALSEAKKRQVEEAIRVSKMMAPKKFEALVAETHEREAKTKEILASIPIAQMREARLQLEASLKTNEKDARSREDYRKQFASLVDKRDKIGNEVIKTVDYMSRLDRAMLEPGITPRAKQSFEGLKAGYLERLNELQGIQQQVIEEYDAAAKRMSELGIVLPTSVNGGPSPSRAAAHRAAVSNGTQSGPTINPAAIGGPAQEAARQLYIQALPHRGTSGSAHKSDTKTKKKSGAKGKVVMRGNGFILREK